MDIKIYPTITGGIIEASSLKSIAHRAIIAAAFADNSTEIIIRNQSVDVSATVNCLNVAGASISGYGGKLTVHPLDFNNGQVVLEDVIDVGESLATFKFILPSITAIFGGGTFTGEVKLPKKNVEEYLFALSGVGFSGDRLPIKANGAFKGGNIKISGSAGSQAISGILMALPLINVDSTLTVVGNVSSGYLVDMTIAVMKDFGVNVIKKGNVYFVGSNEKYHSPETYVIEGDYSLATYYYALGKIGQEIIVSGLKEDSLQPERKIKDFVDKVWADKNAVIDLEGRFDLVYPLLAMTCYKNDITVFKNITQKSEKVMEKFNVYVNALKKMGADITCENDTVKVVGGGTLNGDVFVDSFGDARIAMALTIAAAGAKNPTYLLSADAVQKSFPGFFNDFIRLNGKCEVK